MAKPDWAVKLIQSYTKRVYGFPKDLIWSLEAAKLLRGERRARDRRAVRVVKKAKDCILILDTRTVVDDYIEGYQQACADILAALKE